MQNRKLVRHNVNSKREKFHYSLIDLALTQTGWLYPRFDGPYCPQICACASGCGCCCAHGWRHCWLLYCPYGKRCENCESNGPPDRSEQSMNDAGDVYSSRNGSPQLPWILLHCQHRIANAREIEMKIKMKMHCQLRLTSKSPKKNSTCLVAMKQQEKLQQQTTRDLPSFCA